jgi:hypothetical protein
MKILRKTLSCALAALVISAGLVFPSQLKVSAGGPPPRGPSVSISGNAFVGDTMTGKYNNTTTIDPDSYKYQWSLCDTSSGTFTAINNATEAAYIPIDSQVGKFLELTITPVTGGVDGTPVISSAYEVTYNISKNYDFENANSEWKLTGASITSDTSVIAPSAGSKQVKIEPSANSTNGIAQTITVENSGVYTLSAYVAEAGQSSGSTIGVKKATGESIVNLNVANFTTYNHILANGIVLEKGDTIVIYANGGNGTTFVDDFELKLAVSSQTPEFANIKSFTVNGQVGLSEINTDTHSVEFVVPFGTNVKAIVPVITVSENAKIVPLKNVDFTNPVTYTVTSASGNAQKWTAACKVLGVNYSAHVQKAGWQKTVSNGAIAGTTGKALRAEAVKINIDNAPAGAVITYQAHVQKNGWVNAVSNGQIAGTTGKSLRLEALRISIKGLDGYEIQYRAHVKGKGWMEWQTTKNGTDISKAAVAGTTGKALRMEAVEIRLVKVA